MYQKELVEELEGKPVVKYGIDWRRSEAQIEDGLGAAANLVGSQGALVV